MAQKSKTSDELRKELKIKEDKEAKVRKQNLADFIVSIRDKKFKTLVNGKERKLTDKEVYNIITFLSEKNIHLAEEKTIEEQLETKSDSDTKDILYYIQHEGWKEPTIQKS